MPRYPGVDLTHCYYCRTPLFRVGQHGATPAKYLHFIRPVLWVYVCDACAEGCKGFQYAPKHDPDKLHDDDTPTEPVS